MPSGDANEVRGGECAPEGLAASEPDAAEVATPSSCEDACEQELPTSDLCDESAAMPAIFDVPIEKAATGFGIYFTKREPAAGCGAPVLVVDGFVVDSSSSTSGDAAEDAVDPSLSAMSEKLRTLRNLLQLGDVLIGVNGASCEQMDVVEIVGLLRAAPLGTNTLRFSRKLALDSTSGLESEANAVLATDASGNSSITSSLLGALKKVKTKIREGIEGDEELLQREQEGRELFEKKWLAEFDRLKREYESKWETCTHSADEFCGLLYHSGDQQQQEYLLREYPLLMDAWKDAKLSSASQRVRLNWPAARIAYAAPIEYAVATGASDPTFALTVPSPQTRHVHAPPALHRALDTLRGEFSWRRGDVLALATQLEVLGVASCSDLASALETRSGRFERSLQSPTFPRLTRAISRSLLGHAQHFAKTE